MKTDSSSRRYDQRPRDVHAYPSPWGIVYVVEEDGQRSLRFDHEEAADQSVLELARPEATALAYVRGAALSLALVPDIKRALVVGLGGGSFTTLLRRVLPHAVVESVEIDPVVVDVAQSHFGLVVDRRTPVHVTDAAAFLLSTRKSFDLIFLDAYEGEQIPAHLCTRPFFEAVRARLTPRGVVVMNLATDDADGLAEVASEFACAFPSPLRVREPKFGNTLLYGSKSALPADPSALLSCARHAQRRYSLPFSLEEWAAVATGDDLPLWE
ncbi:MAG: spermidine synthase [Myxococcota bacterium]